MYYITDLSHPISNLPDLQNKVRSVCLTIWDATFRTVVASNRQELAIGPVVIRSKSAIKAIISIASTNGEHVMEVEADYDEFTGGWLLYWTPEYALRTYVSWLDKHGLKI